MQRVNMRERTEPLPIHGALRSRIVAKLAGVTRRQLGYWHRQGIIQANVIAGARGHPRLYSWMDYMKVRAAKKLLRQGVLTRRIRRAIEYLDRHVPNWFLMPIYGFGNRVLIELSDATVTADEARQIALPQVVEMLRELSEEGPLGELRHFSDYIDAHPDIVSGNPILRGTRLEPEFIAALVESGLSPEQVAERYHLTPMQVQRALEFHSAIA